METSNDSKSQNKVYTIALTGGPCAGKTTSIMRIKMFLEKRGFYVCLVPEAATFLRTSGVRWNPSVPNAFQKAITMTQKQHEDTFSEFARQVAAAQNRDAVILCDRGLLDGSVYVTAEMFEECLEHCALPVRKKVLERIAVIPCDRGLLGGSDHVTAEMFEECLEHCALPVRKKVLERYDCVLHLVTAARDAEAFYEVSDLRRESLAEAIEVDEKLQKAWSDHSNVYVFDNLNKSFEVKLRNIVARVCKLMRIPNTSKVPQRFSLSSFPEIPESLSSPVRQFNRKIYLNGAPTHPPPGSAFNDPSEPSAVSSASQSTDPSMIADHSSGEYTFIRMRKSKTSKSFLLKRVTEEEGQRIERKQVLSERQFEEYLIFADPDRHVVEQKRVCFTVDSTYYEIVEYAQPSSGLLLLNVHPESLDHAHQVDLPAWLASSIKSNVSNRFEFSAHYLSLKNPSARQARRASASASHAASATSNGDSKAVVHTGEGDIGGCF